MSIRNWLIITAVIIFVPYLAAQNNTEIIGKQMPQFDGDVMTPEILWAFGRLSDVQLSADGKQILYGVTYYSKEQNKGNRELYVTNIETKETRQLTFTQGGEYNGRWRPDGKRIGFLSARSGSMQLWEMDPDGSNPVQISNIAGGITGFAYAPDVSKILFTKEVKLAKTVQDIYPDLPKSSGRIMNDLMYRHWDSWVDSYSHIFVAAFDGTSLGEAIDIMKNEPYESPMKPFGGMEQITFTPDSKAIVYTCRKKKGKEYSLSTNSDIYLYDLTTKQTTNLTKGMMGYDMNPLFSPDGKKMAWESMERNGYESDKNRLFVMDMTTGKKTYYTKDFDQNVHGLAWDNKGKFIYFISDWHAVDDIYRLDLKSGKIKKITEGVHDYTSVIPNGKELIATKMSMSQPIEVYLVNAKSGTEIPLTFVNKDLLERLTMGKVEKRWVKTTDNKQELVWVIYPPHFDRNKKYPALLYCQGGPQSTVSQFWSYRWNFQMMAANGYIVVAPNRRGLPGFGQEWLEEISGDYGGQNMNDYFSAIDSLSKEPFIDENRLGAVGASYGGYSVYWIAGHNQNKRFKAFIAHDGMFNLESQYLETDEMWFVNWDLGGPFWDTANAVAQRTYKEASPHRFVQHWNTPILIIHGQLDYRIPVTEGMQAFDAAVLLHVPARFLYFPDENHWVLKPQNGILWQRTFFDWLDLWLK